MAGLIEHTRRQRHLITAAVMIGISLAAGESTIIATAMPTIVGRLGGVSLYAWAFTAYLLTLTITVPIYGKLADIYGRKPVYLVSMSIFMLGSILCGTATSMEQLVVYRAIQGAGAGGISPLAFTIVGDIFTLEQRARLQGVISAIWGVASVIAPAIGGLIVDNLAWQWIFFFNIPICLLSLGLLWVSLQERVERHGRPSIDYLGALTLAALVTTLQLALTAFSEQGFSSPRTSGLVALFVILATSFVLIERRVPDPILTYDLFRNPIIRYASIGGFFLSTVSFASRAYIPVYMQGVQLYSATEVGITLIPISIGWTAAAFIAGRLLKDGDFSKGVLAGAACTIGGCLALAFFPSVQAARLIAVSFLGLGAGFSFTTYTIASQNAVDWSRRGSATSVTQFATSIGGTLGMAVLGVAFTSSLTAALGGIPGASPDLANQILDPRHRGEVPADLLPVLSSAIATAAGLVFWLMLLMAFASAVPAVLLRRGSRRRAEVAGPSAAPAQQQAETKAETTVA